MMLFILLAGACNGCRPSLPDGNNDTPPPPQDDTAPHQDSAGDSAGGDSGPPALCDVVEVEPNDLPDQAQALPMEQWACGTFGRYIDTDWLDFTPTQVGWITVEVEAATRGSSANPQLQIESGDDSALSLDGYLTTDPKFVFPATAIDTYSLTLAETNLLYGDDYSWFLHASLTKAPVTWDFDEVEPNDGYLEATPFPLDSTVFGTIGEAGDFDWYKITTPDGETTLTVDVDAFVEGSAADLVLVLYDADGTTVLKTDYSGEIDADLDPHFDRKVTGAQDLYLLARTENDRGSRFHWYTLSITTTTE